MYARAALSFALVLISTLAWGAPLKVDLSQNGPVEPGWIDWNTGGTRLGNANVSRRFQNEADFDDDFTIDFVGIDSRNRGQVNAAIPLANLLSDAFKRSNPFNMVIKGLKAGVYTMTTWHHDPAENVPNDDGTVNITVKDADGTRLVAERLQQSWGTNPVNNPPQSIPPASATFTFRCDGVNDVVITFVDNNDGIHNEAFLNGFALDLAVEPTKASGPQPADKAVDVPRDVILRWTAADTAGPIHGHKVFLSKSPDEVKNGAAAADRGVTTDPVFDTAGLPGALEYGATYYWRIDEGSPAKGYTAGNVWSFTTEPYAYPIPGKAIAASASSSLNDRSTPGKTIDGSGLDQNDRHSTVDSDMWLAGAGGPQPAWLHYAFDKIYCLHEMWVWNYNQTVEPLVGFGLKDVVIEYSVDGTTWTPLAPSTRFARGPGAAGYAHNTTIAFGGVPVRFVRITAQNSWGGGSQYGLSEVRFYHVPVQAREPQPATGATGIGPAVLLRWRAGRQAISHNIYLGTEPLAVQNALVPTASATVSTWDTGTLNLATTYYWRVDEVNATATPAVWTGDVWSFATPAFVVVDDFERYTDKAGEEVFTAWSDGFDTPTKNGALVGLGTAANGTFCDTTTFYGGKASMPFAYDNVKAPLSEATRTFAPAQDWTVSGIKTLVLYFCGDPTNTATELYVKINGTKIAYGGQASDLARRRWKQWNVDLTGVPAATLRSVRTLTIGVTGGTGKLLIDEVRLYGVAPELPVAVDPGPTGLPAASAAPSTAGLIAHYTLDGNVLDSSGNALHGTVNGNPLYTPGIFGQALTFDGVGDYVDCTNNVKYDAITDKITVAAWIQVDIFDVTFQAIVTKGDSSWRLSRNTETDGVHWRANGPDPALRVNSTVSVNDGEWHHVAGTYDGTSARLYVNGRLDGSLATTGSVAKNAQKVFIGGNAEQMARLWKGAIDEVRIYSRVLTEAEVRYLADRTPGDGKL